YDVFSRGRPGAGVQTLVTVNPRLWFMEGMAEYLSLGPINRETAMWLRDAALDGHLPSIEEMTADPYIFPYRYGHALWAYIGEKLGDELSGDEGGFVVDLWLADVETGRVKRHLVKSTQNNNYESLRFINSAGAFSADGRYFAIAAKRKDRDDLVLLDVERGREERRIHVGLNGLQTPQWSPDGQQLVFSGFSNGFTDLFIINRDGTGLRRLTHDKYADLHPSWSPDGKTIAFVTDSGGETDFNLLRFGNLRVALLHLDSGNTELLRNMETGKNINPVWAPDGRSLAFVSDRTGIANVFLYDLVDDQIYQLTNMFTGVQGITPLSPVLSWATVADRMSFVYCGDGQYSVYSLENPRSLRRAPYRGPATMPV